MTASNFLDKDEMEIQLRKRIAELEKFNQDLCAENIALSQEITKCKQAEEALKDIKEKYRRIVTATNYGFWWINPDLIITEASEAIAKLLGYCVDELIGRSGYDFFNKDWLAHASKEWEELKAGKPISCDFKMRRKDGSDVWVRLSSSPIMDKHGRFVGNLIVFTDITEQKQAEETLRESEARQAFLLKLSDALRKLSNSDEIQSTASRILGEQIHADRVPYAHVIDEQEVVITGDYVNGVPSIACTLHASDFSQMTIDAYKEGKWFIFSDVSTDPRFTQAEREAYKSINIASNASLGLVKNGKWVAAFGVHSAKPRVWTEFELNLIAETSERIWAAIERARIEEALTKAYDTLEEKVKERTAELEEAYNYLKESQESLAEAQEIAHLGSWDWDIVTNKVCWSNETYRIFGLNPQELEATFDLYFSRVHPDDRDSIYSAVEKALNGESYSIDYRIILPSGERTVHSYGKVIFDEENTPVRMSGTTQDITDRKKAEEMLKESKSKLKTLFELLPVGVSIVDREINILDANLALENIVGLSRSDLFKGKHTTRIYVKPDGTEMSVEEFPSVRALGEKGSIQNSEIGIIKEDGSTIWTDVSATAIPYYNDQVVIITKDITERKMAEESMRRLEIARKQEIHHRIKNNLQVISSLLDLQAEKFGNREFIMNSEVMEAFRESQNRVVSMALIHEKLHKSEELDTLNFSLYIEELAENLFQTYRLRNSNISLNLDLEENIFFDMDYAVPLGIIINELVSNSLKYAFPGKNEGKIRIELHRDENEEYEKEGCKNTSFTLTVSDNGVGISENLDIEEIDSLGLQLVTSLVEQLDGEFELERNKGTKFNIRFTVKEKNNQVLTLQE